MSYSCGCCYEMPAASQLQAQKACHVYNTSTHASDRAFPPEEGAGDAASQLTFAAPIGFAASAANRHFFLASSLALAFFSTATLAGDPRPTGAVRRMHATASAANSDPALIRSSPYPPSIASDSRFIVDSGLGLDTGCSFREEGPLKFTIKVTRAVGDVNQFGELLSPDHLVANGVVSAYAHLRMPAFDVDSDGDPLTPERDKIRFNGKDIDPSGEPTFLVGKDGVWSMNEFDIPISLVRFGTMNPQGGTPIPGLNDITIDIDTKGGGWCTSIDWAELSFKALAPVIMVHGNNSNSLFFSSFKYPEGVRQQPFVGPFQLNGIPYDDSIELTNDRIVVNGGQLAQQIPMIAAAFGAGHAHIVAHSKGGLDSREALDVLRRQPTTYTGTDKFSVLSLTTLATPHHGSVAADYYLAAQRTSLGRGTSPLRTWLAKFAFWFSKSDTIAKSSLTTNALNNFNDTNILPAFFMTDGDDEPAPVKYYSVGSDAKLPLEELGLGPAVFVRPVVLIGPDVAGTGYPVWLNNIIYNMVGNVASVAVSQQGVVEQPTGSFQLNDLLVTVNSSRFVNTTTPAFAPKVPFLNLSSSPADSSFNPSDNVATVPPANHATIANSAIADIVIGAIQDAQPIKAPQAAR